MAEFKARAETLEQHLKLLSREKLSSHTEPDVAQDEGETMTYCQKINSKWLQTVCLTLILRRKIAPIANPALACENDVTATPVLIEPATETLIVQSQFRISQQQCMLTVPSTCFSFQVVTVNAHALLLRFLIFPGASSGRS
jgi:hypothetical protein